MGTQPSPYNINHSFFKRKLAFKVRQGMVIVMVSPGNELKSMKCPQNSLCLHVSSFTPHLLLLLSRCSPMERPSTAQTCWMTPAVWLCWWWAFCCSPLCSSWHSPHTVDWPGTSSWACVSFPTAVPSIRTCPPHASGVLVQEAAVASGALQRGRGRVACGFRTGQEDCIWLSYVSLEFSCLSLDFFKANFHCLALSKAIVKIHHISSFILIV